MMIFNKKTVLTALFVACAMVSLFQSVIRAVQQRTEPSVPLHSLTREFTGLTQAFAHIERAGYYSDKNMDFPLAIAQFEQAQYVLAPTVLELNNTSLPVVIFDCATAKAALDKIKELKLIPVSANTSGIVLAVNPNWNKP